MNASQESRDSGWDEGEVVYGLHPVLAALESSSRPIERICLIAGRRHSLVARIHRLARDKGIEVRFVPKPQIERMAPGRNHQGVVAQIGLVRYADPDDLLGRAAGSGWPPFLVCLDGVNDPHNLGAVLRTADATGVHGVVIPRHGAVAVTAAVARVAVGAAETVPVARVSNLATTLRSFKEQGLTAVGLAPASGSPIWSADLRVPLVIVAGGEERGLRRLVSETCDALVSIPMRGKISSLNVSVALGIACYEVLRQRTVP